MLDAAAAQHFADTWISAWNAHDLEAILAHYTEDVAYASPMVVKVLGDPSGTFHGKEALRPYFARAFEIYPDLKFTLREVLVSVNSVCVYYTSVKELTVAEVFELDDQGHARRVTCHYAAAIT